MERMRVKPLPRYAAGVDPGQQTGIGVYDRVEGRIVYITTTDFFGAAPWLMRMVRISDLRVFVEVPARFVYFRNEDLEQKVRDNLIHKAGGTRREAELLAELLRREGFDVREVPPIREEKWDARKFQQVCKSRRETNQHERDACRLAIANATKREFENV